MPKSREPSSTGRPRSRCTRLPSSSRFADGLSELVQRAGDRSLLVRLDPSQHGLLPLVGADQAGLRRIDSPSPASADADEDPLVFVNELGRLEMPEVELTTGCGRLG